MSNSIASINVRIGARLDGLEKGLKSAERSLRSSGRRMAMLGDQLTQSISLPLIGIGIASVKTAGEMDAMKKALKQQLGSVTKATAEMNKLEEAARMPGLGFQQAIKGSVRLQAVQFSADEAREALSQFGNAIALAGGGAAQLDGVTLALTQIVSKGKVMAEEINQIAERVPQIRQIMLNAYGTADTEVLQKMKLDAKDFVNTIVDEMKRLPRVGGNLKNTLENAGISIQKFFYKVGITIADTLNLDENIAAFSMGLESVADSFTAMDGSTQQAIVGLGLFLVSVGPVIKILGTFKLAAAAMITNFRSIVAGTRAAAASLYAFDMAAKRTIGGLALTGIIVGLTLAYNHLSAASTAAGKAQKIVAEAQKEVARETGAEIRALDENFEKLKNENVARRDKQKAIAALLTQYPKYFSGIDLEKASIQELTQLQKGLNDSILKGVAARKKSEALDDIYGQILEKQLRIQEIQNGGADALGFVESFNTDLLGINRLAGETGEEFAIRSAIEGLQEEIKELDKLAGATSDSFDNLFNTQRTASGRGSTPNLGGNTSTTSTPISASTNEKELTILQKLEKKLSSINALAAIYKSPFSEVQIQKAKAYNDALEKLLKQGFKPASKEITQVSNALADLMPRQKLVPFLKSASLVDTTLESISKKAKKVGKVEIVNDSTISKMSNLNDALVKIDHQAAIFGGTFDATKAKISTITSEMTRLIQEGVHPTSEAITELSNELNDLKEQEAINSFTESLNAIIESGIENTLSGIGSELGNILLGVGDFGNVAGVAIMGIANIMEQFGKLAISAGVTSEAIKKAFGLKGIGAIIAGVSLVALSKVVRAKAQSLIPEFADGGLVSGPTMAMVGEYGGAANNPEFIAPVDKAVDIFTTALRKTGYGATSGGSGGMNGRVEFEIRGDKLFGILENYQRDRTRTRGY